MASEPAGLISMILQSRPGACDNTSRGKSRRSQAPGLWQRMPACPPTASLAPEPGRELSKAVEKEVAPAGKQTERLLDFLTGPAHARGLRASSERPARLRNSPFLLWSWHARLKTMQCLHRPVTRHRCQSPGWRVAFEATPQKLGWTSVPWPRELSWFCGSAFSHLGSIYWLTQD
ncbi:PREDICTED: uncharacterized protein LOC102253566 isoform X1 [Myotis brandtii]|uniref:uncharacterized protein LOC102253566 isoform X1 n=1 Tax=Myotis brandtii TaxID=109478 RepID=UPI00070411CB|nr:PREDICTED: uncharacterized protein LOC102253566 isoform X1 [Myotis brandtii]